MRKKSFKCPNCKKKTKIDASRDFGFCTYCGSKIQIKKDFELSAQNVQDETALPENKQQSKKPWYKTWWIWLIIGLGFLTLVSMIEKGISNNSKQTVNNDRQEIITEKVTETTTEKETETTTKKEIETTSEEETETTTEEETETIAVPKVPPVTPVEGFNTLQSMFLSVEKDWTMDYVKDLAEASGLYAFIDEGEESDYGGYIFTKCIQVAEAPYTGTSNGSEKYEFDGDYIWLVYKYSSQQDGYYLKTGDYVIESNGIRVGLDGTLSRGVAGTVPRPDTPFNSFEELFRYALDKPRYNGGNW